MSFQKSSVFWSDSRQRLSPQYHLPSFLNLNVLLSLVVGL